MEASANVILSVKTTLIKLWAFTVAEQLVARKTRRDLFFFAETALVLDSLALSSFV